MPKKKKLTITLFLTAFGSEVICRTSLYSSTVIATFTASIMPLWALYRLISNGSIFHQRFLAKWLAFMVAFIL